LRAPIRVNGVTLPNPVIAEEAQNHPAKTPAAAFETAAQALVIRHLLLEEAKHCAVETAPAVIAPGKREAPDEACIRALIEMRVPLREAEEAECLAFYRANPARFRSPDLFEVSHILFAAHPDKRDDLAEAVRHAQQTIEELAQEPHRFETLARERSACQSRANGGRLGQIAPGETVPEFEAALYALKQAEIAAAPVKSRFGAHVLRLDARKAGEQLPFEYVRERIAAYLAERTWRQEAARYIAGLIASAQIEGIDIQQPQPAPTGAA